MKIFSLEITTDLELGQEPRSKRHNRSGKHDVRNYGKKTRNYLINVNLEQALQRRRQRKARTMKKRKWAMNVIKQLEVRMHKYYSLKNHRKFRHSPRWRRRRSDQIGNTGVESPFNIASDIRDRLSAGRRYEVFQSYGLIFSEVAKSPGSETSTRWSEALIERTSRRFCQGFQGLPRRVKKIRYEPVSDVRLKIH